MHRQYRLLHRRASPSCRAAKCDTAASRPDGPLGHYHHVHPPVGGSYGPVLAQNSYDGATKVLSHSATATGR